MSRVATLSCLLLATALASCSSGGGSSGGSTSGGDVGGTGGDGSTPVGSSSAGSTTAGSTPSDPDRPFEDMPEPLRVVQADPARINSIPEIATSEWLADTGLQVAWANGTSAADVDAAYVGGEWVYMQDCTGIVASPPLVVITPGPVDPLLANDDVIRDIEGRPIASASQGTVVILQVQVADFDGSLGNTGFHLRSIAGRHLWLSANLAERDYPYLCARRE